MMRRLWFGLLFATACAPDPEGSPVAPDRGEFLFGATEEQILDVAARLDLDPEVVLDRMSAFDCERWGDLCALVGEDRALDAAALEWELALTGLDPAAIESELALAVEAGIEDHQQETEGLRFGTTSNTYVNPSDADERVRTEYGTVNPLFSRAYSFTDIRHEKRVCNPFCNWANDDATNLLATTDDHVHYTYTLSGQSPVTTYYDDGVETDSGPSNRQTAYLYHDKPAACGWEENCTDSAQTDRYYEIHQQNRDACVDWDTGGYTCLF